MDKQKEDGGMEMDMYGVISCTKVPQYTIQSRTSALIRADLLGTLEPPQ